MFLGVDHAGIGVGDMDRALAFWRDKFRAAQCAANPGNAVNAEVESISSLFALSQEYASRARNNRRRRPLCFDTAARPVPRARGASIVRAR